MSKLKQLINMTDDLPIDKRKLVYNLINSYGYKIIEHGDGSRVNLDKFQPEHLNELYTFVKCLSAVEPTHLL